MFAMLFPPGIYKVCFDSRGRPTSQLPLHLLERLARVPEVDGFLSASLAELRSYIGDTFCPPPAILQGDPHVLRQLASLDVWPH